MIPPKINILLADDDQTDCLLFKDALSELPIAANLITVNDGEQLIAELNTTKNELPDVLFLDLNMPRKNGFASLGLIKRSTKLQHIPVIIFSTTSEMDAIKQVYKEAAHYFITKPVAFFQLKKVIYEALTLISKKNNPMPLTENFVITGDSIAIPELK